MNTNSVYPVERHECGVWMMKHRRGQSAAREIAEQCLEGLRIDRSDFRQRDEVIASISETVWGMLNYLNSMRAALEQITRAQHSGSNDARYLAGIAADALEKMK